ncbi:hypothetical protein [Jannaschia seohaensis]|nr:hypothetical protein [Jannaschia seohaensis]
MMLLIAPGPVMLYQGEERGLRQPSLPKSAITDPYDLLYWPDMPGRDGARVPIPLGRRRRAGLYDRRPMAADGLGVSVTVQDAGADSNLAFYRRAAAFRRDRLGDLTLQDWSQDGEAIRLLYPGVEVVLNFGQAPVGARPEPDFCSAEIEGASLPARTGAVWLD